MWSVADSHRCPQDDAKLLQRTVIGEPGQYLVGWLVVSLIRVFGLLLVSVVPGFTDVLLTILDGRARNTGSSEGEVIRAKVGAVEQRILVDGDPQTLGGSGSSEDRPERGLVQAQRRHIARPSVEVHHVQVQNGRNTA